MCRIILRTRPWSGLHHFKVYPTDQNLVIPNLTARKPGEGGGHVGTWAPSLCQLFPYTSPTQYSIEHFVLQSNMWENGTTYGSDLSLYAFFRQLASTFFCSNTHSSLCSHSRHTPVYLPKFSQNPKKHFVGKPEDFKFWLLFIKTHKGMWVII